MNHDVGELEEIIDELKNEMVFKDEDYQEVRDEID